MIQVFTTDRTEPKKVLDGLSLLTPEALDFLTELEKTFGARREKLLDARKDRQKALQSGVFFGFLPETAIIRSGDWKVASTPKDLENRRVEITGPAEPKMVINALNSAAEVFMADFEDSLSPTWKNLLAGQQALYGAARGSLTFKSPEGKTYTLKTAPEKTATLKVRPRGWHLQEKNLTLSGKPVSASLFDFGLFFFHNAKALLAKGSGPYFYLPKMESHLEARLWNDVFTFSQKRLGIPHGSIRATVLIETLPAAFEMEEILYELRDHASGLNAGRWDYIFSLIKKLRAHPAARLPDRSQVTMRVPFMATYAQLLVATCHRRGAHAMGGMSAFIPSRKDEAVNQRAFEQVRADKKREVGLGFDGTWVAHPDLVEVAKTEFVAVLGDRLNQKEKPIDSQFALGLHPEREAAVAISLQDTSVEGSTVTEAGIRNNIQVGIAYLHSWLSGVGAAAIHNLMEDAATAEISRAQLWQWRRSGQRTAEGIVFTADIYHTWKKEELLHLSALSGPNLVRAAKIFDDLVLADEFTDFLTLPAYEFL
jgi:malate synthase